MFVHNRKILNFLFLFIANNYEVHIELFEKPIFPHGCTGLRFDGFL